MTDTNSKPATLRDVAQLAGVSYQTVSRYINDHPNVSPKARQAIQKAIAELNFRPNKMAQALNTGRSKTLQIISFDLDYFTYLLPGLIKTSHELEYQTGLAIVIDASSDAELNAVMDNLSGRAIDGFIWLALLQSHTAEHLSKICGNTPYVIIGANPGPETPSVVIDQAYGVQVAMQHLYNLGHRRIAEISGWVQSYDGHARHQAYLQFIKDNHLPDPIWTEGGFGFESGYQGVKQLLQQHEKFTALMCGNDKTAIGAIAALHEMGLRVPQDVSVVGFDDVASSAYSFPPLTSVRQDFDTLSKQAMEYLVSMIENPGTPVHQRVLYPQLVVRNSTMRA